SGGTVVVTAFPSGDNVNTGQRPDVTPPDSATRAVRSRAAAGAAGADSTARAEAAAPPTVAVQHLTPQKARILLMLALTRTHDPREVQRYFDRY
ncbi:MAG: hypothetical protein OEW77_11540, partial [Gemmatimonadota bacterium]|nr:hypothetical protein [Gemmatimonadota bacterium]